MSPAAFLPARALPAPASFSRRGRPLVCSSAPVADAHLFLKGPVPGDRLLRTLSANGEVSCCALSCTGLARGASLLHNCSPVASVAFGRVLACALLLSAGRVTEEVQIEFRGDGPLGSLRGIANGRGECRGYLGDPSVVAPAVSNAVGKGVLAVIRSSLLYSTRPYTGLVPIVSGEIAEDVATYLADSEQIESALGAGVFLNSDARVEAAGGYLLQLLPGCSEESRALVARNVSRVGGAGGKVREGVSLEVMVDMLMDGLEPMKGDVSSPRYFCGCGVERVRRTVALIPETEVRDLLRDFGKVEGAFFFSKVRLLRCILVQCRWILMFTF